MRDLAAHVGGVGESEEDDHRNSRVRDLVVYSSAQFGQAKPSSRRFSSYTRHDFFKGGGD
jgi:hypothetical protein